MPYISRIESTKVRFMSPVYRCPFSDRSREWRLSYLTLPLKLNRELSTVEITPYTTVTLVTSFHQYSNFDVNVSRETFVIPLTEPYSDLIFRLTSVILHLLQTEFSQRRPSFSLPSCLSRLCLSRSHKTKHDSISILSSEFPKTEVTDPQKTVKDPNPNDRLNAHNTFSFLQVRSEIYAVSETNNSECICTWRCFFYTMVIFVNWIDVDCWNFLTIGHLFYI